MSAKPGLVSIVCVQLGVHKKHLLYKVAGCLLLRGCLSIEVNEGQSGFQKYPLYSKCLLLRDVH